MSGIKGSDRWFIVEWTARGQIPTGSDVREVALLGEQQGISSVRLQHGTIAGFAKVYECNDGMICVCGVVAETQSRVGGESQFYSPTERQLEDAVRAFIDAESKLEEETMASLDVTLAKPIK